MKTLLNPRERSEVLERLGKLQAESRPGWGTMTAHQMVCHLSDSFRGSLGEKRVEWSGSLFTRTLLKWAALWIPRQWPHGVKAPPELDQQKGGTRPAEFRADLEKLRTLFDRFCACEGEFAPHAFFGRMSRGERMRHAYLHMDHHLRQFGI